MNVAFLILAVVGVGLATAGILIGVNIMTAADRIAAAQERIATSITNVATDIRELVEKVTTPGGLTEEQAAEVASKMEASATALEAAAAEFKNSTEPE